MDLDATPSSNHSGIGDFTPLLRSNTPSESDLSPTFQYMSRNLKTFHPDFTTTHNASSFEDRGSSTPKRDYSELSPPKVIPNASFWYRQYEGRKQSKISMSPLSRRFSEGIDTAQNQTGHQSNPIAISEKTYQDILEKKQEEVVRLRNELKEYKRMSDDDIQIYRQKQQEQELVIKRLQDENEDNLDSEHRRHHEAEQQLQQKINNLQQTIVDLRKEVNEEISRKHEQEERAAQAEFHIEKLDDAHRAALERASQFEQKFHETRSKLVEAENKASDAVSKRILAEKNAENAIAHKTSMVEKFEAKIKENAKKEKVWEKAMRDLEDERNNLRIKLANHERLLKAAMDNINTFENSERALTQEHKALQEVHAKMSVNEGKLREQITSLEGDIAVLRNNIEADARVMELRRELQQKDKQIIQNEGQISTLEKINASLEQRTSQQAQSDNLMAANLENTALTSKITTLEAQLSESKQRLSVAAITIRKHEAENEALQNNINSSRQLQANGDSEIQSMLAQLGQARQEAQTLQAELNDLKSKYNRLHSECVLEINRVKASCGEEIAGLKRDNDTIKADYIEKIEQAERDYTAKLFALDEKKTTESQEALNTLQIKSQKTITEALDKQRRELVSEYQEHLQNIESNSESLVSEKEKTIQLEVENYKRDLVAAAQNEVNKAREVYVDMEKLQKKFQRTINALYIVTEYHKARDSRLEWIMEDLIFIKNIGSRCLNQIFEDDRRRLEKMGLQYEPKRTFAGIANFVLSSIRMHNLRRPEIPKEIERRYEEFRHTGRC